MSGTVIVKILSYCKLGRPEPGVYDQHLVDRVPKGTRYIVTMLINTTDAKTTSNNSL